MFLCKRWNIFLAAVFAIVVIQAGPLRAESILYKGGQVWNGETFQSRDILVRDGHFVDAESVDRIVDLSGKYIVPAYANAHAHVTSPDQATSDYFLKIGVFYAWNPGTIVLGEKARSYFARPDTFDVKLANGAITEPGGHPEKLYVDILTKYVYPGKDKTYFLGNSFHYGTTREEIRQALDILVSQNSDFVKGILVYSEEYNKRKDDPAYYGINGLNPENIPTLVDEASIRGLQVALHVETVRDLLVAAEASARMAAHLPGYGYKASADALLDVTLTADEASKIAGSGIILVPTYSVAAESYKNAVEADPHLVALHMAAQSNNLRQLANANAIFAIGTDQDGEIFTETEYLAKLDVFSREALLKIVFGTGALLFPDRRIGCFQAGCEADFLVLGASPSGDLTALRQIEMRVKAGKEL